MNGSAEKASWQNEHLQLWEPAKTRRNVTGEVVLWEVKLGKLRQEFRQASDEAVVGEIQDTSTEKPMSANKIPIDPFCNYFMGLFYNFE